MKKLKIDLEMIKNNIFPGKQTAESRLMTSDFRSELAEKTITLASFGQNSCFNMEFGTTHYQNK